MLGHTSTTTDAATSSAVENMPESAVTVQIPTPVAVLGEPQLPDLVAERSVVMVMVTERPEAEICGRPCASDSRNRTPTTV